jgi:fatty-acid desaturase
LPTVYILYALLKFFEFFFRDEETKRKGLYTVHVKGGGAVVKIFDNVMLAFMLVLLGLLFWGGVEYVSFTTGLLVGMTTIQVYFHRFSRALAL